jgi:hypothetical protein
MLKDDHCPCAGCTKSYELGYSKGINYAITIIREEHGACPSGWDYSEWLVSLINNNRKVSNANI